MIDTAHLFTVSAAIRDHASKSCKTGSEAELIGYPSKRDAATARNFIQHHRGRFGNRGRSAALRIYPCPLCGGWHLTKKV